MLSLALFSLLQIQAHAAVVTLGIASTATRTDAGVSGYCPYSSSESIFTAAEIGGGGDIISFALNKESGVDTTVIDSVYIYMKETTATSVPANANLTGYNLVYSGNFPNNKQFGWMTVPLSVAFAYTGKSNLSVLIVRHAGKWSTTAGSPYFYVHENPSYSHAFYYQRRLDYWKGWGTNTAEASSGFITTARPQVQLGINPFLCSGRPIAGTVITASSSVCTGTPVIFSLTGTSLASSLSFNWDTSRTGSGGWALAGSTTATYGVWSFMPPPAGETLHFRCRVTCGALSDTSGPIVITTNKLLSTPYTENFESGTDGVNSSCAAHTYSWGSKSGSDWNLSTAALSAENHTPGGKKYLLSGREIGSLSDEFWFSPAIALNKGEAYTASYWYNNSGAGSRLGLYIGNAQSKAAMIIPLLPDTTVARTTNYTQIKGSFIAPATGAYYLGVNIKNVLRPTLIDDIELRHLPRCSGIPVAGPVSATPSVLCNPGKMILDMKIDEGTGLTYRWETTALTAKLTDSSTTHSVGDSSGAYTPLSENLAAPLFETPVIDADASFRCVIKCTLTGDSVVSETIKVNMGILSVPYVETFEKIAPGNNPPCAGHTASWILSTHWYTVGVDTFKLTNHTAGGRNWLSGGTSLSTGKDYWFTPAIKLTGKKLYEFAFWYQFSGSLAAGDSFKTGAFIGDKQAAASMTSAIGPVIGFDTPTDYQRYAVHFMPDSSGTYYLGVYVNASSRFRFAIDDISLREARACEDSVVSGKIYATVSKICNPGENTDLELKGSTLATGLAYTWQFRSDTGTWKNTGVDSRVHNTASIFEPTWFRCIVTCSASGASDTAMPIHIDVGASDIPYTEDFESTRRGQMPRCSEATYWWSSYLRRGWSVYQEGYNGSYINHTPGGKHYLIGGSDLGFKKAPDAISDDNFWYTPGIRLRSGHKYGLSFWYVGSSGKTSKNRMGIFWGNAQSVAAMTNVIIPFDTVRNIIYTQAKAIFEAPVSGVYYLGFKKSSGVLGESNPDGIAFDDISLNYAACDGDPVAGMIKSSVSPVRAMCKGTIVTLTNIGATVSLVPGISFQWERQSLSLPSGWQPVAGATDTVLSADTLVGYEYRLAVICTNKNDTSRSGRFSLPEAIPHPAVAIAPDRSPLVYCSGDTVHLSATKFTDATYDWIREEQIIAGWRFNDLNITEPGHYKVKVVSPLSPCPAYSKVLELQKQVPGYTVSVTTPSDSIFCADRKITLSAMASKAGLSYKWSRDNVDIPGATAPSYIVTSSGYYRVIAFDTSAECPAASRSIKMTVRSVPDVAISIPDGSLTGCAETGVKLDANKGAFSYQWSREGSPVYGWVDSSIIATHSGTYTVKVTMADGCANVSKAITISILPSPAPLITRTGYGLATVLSSRAIYANYKWIRSGIGGIHTEGNTSSIGIAKKGVYKLVVTDHNGCIGTSAPMDIMDDGLNIRNINEVSRAINVYPNPTTGKIFIESPVNIIISVLDVNGKILCAHFDSNEVDLADAADGIYTIIIRDETGVQLLREEKIIKTSLR